MERAATSGAVDAPLRIAAGTELLGQFHGAGVERPEYLLRRSDGQIVQITELLHLLAVHLDGERDLDEVAAAVTRASGRAVDGGDVRMLVDRLRPLGVIASGSDDATPLPRARPVLGLRARIGMVPEPLHRRVTTVLQLLFTPAAVATTLAAFVLFDLWIGVFHRGAVVDGLKAVLYDPKLLLLISVITWTSMVFHELGHAAALRYSGGTPGSLGAGFYLVWPVLYTDVTDSYRLDRRGRLRTDLGGVYFNVVFLVAASTAFAITGYAPLLVFIALAHIQTLQQFLPFVRLDGYYVVSDLVGVPNLFAYLRPVIDRMARRRDADVRRLADARLARLKPWARRVITGWVLLTVPVLAVNIASLLYFAPQIVGLAWGSVKLQLDALDAAIQRDAVGASINAAFGLVMLAAPAFGLGAVIAITARRVAGAAWRAGHAHVVVVPLFVVALAAGVGSYARATWPQSFEEAVRRVEAPAAPPARVDQPTVQPPPPAPGKIVDVPPKPAPPPTTAPPAPITTPPECAPDAAGRRPWLAELSCPA
jgi:putative peptide zinc metalloprotease protein